MSVDDYNRGYREGYRDGQEDATKQPYPTNPWKPAPMSKGIACPKCNGYFEGVTSYSCPQTDCPIFTKTIL